MQVGEVCTPQVVTCPAQTRALQAAILMRKHHVGDLVVVDENSGGNVPMGVVTDRDLAIEVLGRELDPAHVTVGTLVRKPVIIAQESEDISAVIERMRTHGVRRVPVVNAHGAISGIVTLDDLLRLVIGDASALLEIMTRGQKHEQHARR